MITPLYPFSLMYSGEKITLMLYARNGRMDGLDPPVCGSWANMAVWGI
jgi:hypothetical protein